MSARVPMRGTGTEQAVVAVKDRNGSGAKGLPHCAHGRNPNRGRKGFSLYGKGKDRAALYVSNRLIAIQDGMFIICSINLLAVAMM